MLQLKKERQKKEAQFNSECQAEYGSGFSYNKWIKKAGIIFVWLLVWEVIALAIANAIVLASPLEVLMYLKEHITDSVFWASVFKSLISILTGFITAFFAGIILGVLSHRYDFFREVLSPLFAMMKATPVAAITVLLLLWFGAENLSVIICFLIVLPNIYEQMLVGLGNVPSQLVELASCYQMSFGKKMYFIYARHLAPYLLGSVRICVGLSFKSAVAAEIIATPLETMGERLYFSKIHLDTPGMFAWTFVIIILSVLTEKVIYGLLKWLLLGENKFPKGTRMEEKIENDVMKEQMLQEQMQHSDKQSKSLFGQKNEQAQMINKHHSCQITCITINNVSKSYGNQNVLKEFERTIRPGECIVITGASGIGKTTLLRLLAGFISPDKGSILYRRDWEKDRWNLETDIRNLEMDKEGTSANNVSTVGENNEVPSRKNKSERKRKRKGNKKLPKIAMIFQDEVLIESLSALTNIEMVRNTRLSSEEKEDLRKILPKDSLNKKADELSGGMKRRVQIARAMFSDGEILLMDEPFRGLDEKTKEKCIDFINKYRRERILIVSAHEDQDAGRLGGTVWKLESH